MDNVVNWWKYWTALKWLRNAPADGRLCKHESNKKGQNVVVLTKLNIIFIL
jgi:hypothetical protein